MIKLKRTLTEATKKQIAGKQRYKCANKPGANLERLGSYECLLWQHIDPTLRGIFDESGYDIDHIEEFCKSGNDSTDNLQALCKTCHIVKTKNFMKQKSKKVIKIKKDLSNDNDYMNDVCKESEPESKSESEPDSESESGSEPDLESESESETYIDHVNEEITKQVKHESTSFICTKCNKEFKAQQNLDYHIFKKACKQPLCYCKYCNRGFTIKTNMYAHIRTTCKQKQKDDNEKEDILAKLVINQKKYHEELRKLKKNNKILEKNQKTIDKENKKLKKIVRLTQ
jgi:hypothetical protein